MQHKSPISNLISAYTPPAPRLGLLSSLRLLLALSPAKGLDVNLSILLITIPTRSNFRHSTFPTRRIQQKHHGSYARSSRWRRPRRSPSGTMVLRDARVHALVDNRYYRYWSAGAMPHPHTLSTILFIPCCVCSKPGLFFSFSCLLLMLVTDRECKNSTGACSLHSYTLALCP